MLILKLFLTFMMIGVFSFGGGYGMVSFIQKEIVVKYGWLQLDEFTDMIAISQTTPGPLAINTATYTGFKMAGIPGALVANLGLLIPAMVIVLAANHILHKHHDSPVVQGVFAGLKPATVALLAASTITIGIQNIVSVYSGIAFILALILLYKFKFNPILLILLFGVVGIVIF